MSSAWWCSMWETPGYTSEAPDAQREPPWYGIVISTAGELRTSARTGSCRQRELSGCRYEFALPHRGNDRHRGCRADERLHSH